MNHRKRRSVVVLHWAIHNVLATSERPGFPSHAVPSELLNTWLDEVRRLGFRSVITLLSDEEMAVYFRDLQQPLGQHYADAGLIVHQISHIDHGTVLSKRVFIERVKAAFISLPKPVLIHCNAGVERSQLAITTICRFWRSRNKRSR